MNEKDTPEEVAQLRQQLDEAKETLRAITSGEVDALVVNTKQGEKVFTLQGADTVYRITIENINEGAITLSPEGTILYSNHYFAQMVRTDLNKIIGASIFDFTAPENHDQLAAMLEQDNWRGELTLRSGDGTLVPTYMATIKLQLDSLSICAVVTDLTQQKRNEELIRSGEALKESEERFRTLSETSPIGVGVSSADGVLLYTNPSYELILGYDHAELIGKKAIELCWNTEERSSWLGAMKHSGVVRNFETRLKRKDGMPVWVSINASPIFYDGKQAVMGTIQDITEGKKAEEELHRYREHLEELVRDRTRELRELSHRLVDAQEKERTTIGNELHDEIGQSLTYTMLLIEKAARKPDQQTLVEAKYTVQEAISQIRNLSSMLSPRLLRSAGLLQALVSLIEEYTRRTNIKIEFDHTDRLEEVPEDIALAAYRITQEALTNVARHAKASEVKVRLLREPGKLRLEVADNGTGFNPGTLKKSTGLTGMRERALALGGELTIASNHGEGTRVIADLPLSETESA